MKVKIGPYTKWFGPYQLAEKILFWVPKERDEYGLLHTAHRVHQFGEWLAHGSIEPEPAVGEVTKFSRDRPNTWLYKLLLWIDSKKKRKVAVKIHGYDTWAMYETLALIILPLLKQLQVSNQGSPWVDDADVPEHLRSTSAPLKANEWDIDDNHHARWQHVLAEMIFAFDSVLDVSWEDQFTTGVADNQSIKQEDGNYKLIKGPNDTYHVDWDAKKIYAARIQQGFILFGKYFQTLWT